MLSLLLCGINLTFNPIIVRFSWEFSLLFGNSFNCFGHGFVLSLSKNVTIIFYINISVV